MLSKTNKTKFIPSIIYSLVITFLISYLFTSKLILAASIVFFDAGLKIFFFYFFNEFWIKIIGVKVKPTVIWFTGLSASGKTTVANDLVAKLKKKSINPVLLDGDEIRQAINQHGYDEESRKKHNLNVGYISSLFEKQGNVVVVSLISPYDDIRNEVRKMCSNFVEVYVATDLQVCISRDPKGLYRKAQAGLIKDFTGISAPYFAPSNPEITIDTSILSVDDCSNLILNFIIK